MDTAMQTKSRDDFSILPFRALVNRNSCHSTAERLVAHQTRLTLPATPLMPEKKEPRP